MQSFYRRVKQRLRFFDLPLRLVEGARTLSRLRNRWPIADRADSLSCDPLLFVSAGRSGTTLLRSMLVVGGQIAIPPESQSMRAAARKFLTLQYLGWEDLSRVVIGLFAGQRKFHYWGLDVQPVYRRVMELPEAERSLARIIDEIFCHYRSEKFPQALLWGDQTPSNALELPWILRTFPSGRYLHVLRDGRDAVASMLEKGHPFEEATRRWTVTYRNALRLRREVPGHRFLEVRYEALVAEPAQVLERVCGFAGIEYKPEMLEYWRSDTTVEHRFDDFHQNLAKPVFQGSVGKWREILSDEQKRRLEAEMGPALAELGYEASSNR